ncbi:MAG: adenylate/guanylate cyclase domain-containing protein [Magnetococcales bacterium]|nr:adenylate/guanylate cyclase domain-containing protein [Magnetococcales bacterium]
MRIRKGPKNALVLTLLVTLATLAGWLGVEDVGILRIVEQWVGDLRVARLQPAEPQHGEIIVVAITEETLERFPYRAPIDRQFLSDLLQELQARGARAILLDILLDQPTEPDKDQALRTTLRRMTIPMVVSYIHGEHYLTPLQSAFLDDFVPPEQRGLANLIKDHFDNAVRWIFPGKEVPGQGRLLGVAGLLVFHLGITPPQQMIPMIWHGRPDPTTEPFTSYPAHLVPLLPKAWFADKIILVGADLSLTDRHRTPFSTFADASRGLDHSGTTGVVVHAHAVAQLLAGRTSPEPGHISRILLLTTALLGMAWRAIPLNLAFRLMLAMVALLIFWVAGFELYHLGGPLLPLLGPTLTFTLALTAGEIYLGREEREQRKFIKNAFSRYLSPAVVEQLLNDQESLRLGGERREMTFLFTDIAEFTAFSEAMEATELTHLLNRYLDGVCQVILRHEGTVINFVGDAVFALFGAPAHQEDHPARAMACALELDAFAEGFRLAAEQQGIPFGMTRIGVHTGYAAIGNMGSEVRFQYTSLGDAVNTAARLESFNKFTGGRIAISAATATRAPHLPTRPVAEVLLKGKSQTIQVLEPLTAAQGDAWPITRYREAYDGLLASELDAATVIFQQLASADPPDPLALFHLNRIRSGARDATVRMETK